MLSLKKKYLDRKVHLLRLLVQHSKDETQVLCGWRTSKPSADGDIFC